MKSKRIIGILLTLTMIIGLLPITANAAEIVASQPANGDGSASSPYQIGTAAELYWFALQVNSGNTGICGKLTADITLNENLESKLNITTTGYAFNYGKATLKSGQTVNEWTAIGTETNAYTGTFDGDGHSVIGLYVNSTASTSKNNGLFGYVKDVTIQNVTVKDSYISAYSHMGGVVGLLYSGTVKNCHCTDTWLCSQNGRMGGIVGSAHQSGGNISISDCSSNVVYYQYGNSGGIAGYLRKATMDNCVFTGELKGTSGNSGGIVGSFTGGTIKNCSNNGKINGGGYTGGIAGYSSGSIINCTNNAAITTSSNAQYIGGIVGDFYGDSTELSEITNCVNNGTVTQTGNNSNLSIGVGGIVGQAKGVSITGCTNKADISGAGQELGGILGTQTMSGNVTIEKCANYGSITGGADFAGGIAGKLTYTSLVKDSYNVGAVSCVKYPGGIVGYLQGPSSSTSTDTAVVTGCYSAASVSGTNGGAITGRMNYYATIQNNYYDSTKFTGSANGYTVGSGQTISGNVGKTTTQFADGTVLALLNGDASEADKIWFQTIGVQPTPEFKAAKFTVVAFDATSKTASVSAPVAGTYTVIFADYEGERLANIEYTTVTFTEETKGTALTASITKGFSLSAGDKIMLWSDMTNFVPKCEAYVLK
ncbi:MAG: hypothetical protein J6D26_05865 [Clostridia bacterium]|nr:hypothetical protein [Clostridia bacterium]